MFVTDTSSLTLDLSPGNYGLKPEDELSKLNLLSLFQAVEVRLNVGQSVRMASIAAMAGRITSLTISGHKDLLDLKRCVGLSYLKLSDLSGVSNVDVSGLAVLNTLEFEECADLAALNASGCTELSEIKGCSGLTGLITLDVGDSKFSDLDLVNSVGLQFLTIPGNMNNLRLPRFINYNCKGGIGPAYITVPGREVMRMGGGEVLH
ncbi:MAG: hypothetical protein LBL30_04345 [Holosporales bacterium]|jgi:hypothetical protein|nr:hypothetical protein [Holosporales bacterium]